MQSHSKTFFARNGAQVEIGTIIYEGNYFTASGALIDEAGDLIIGYPKNGKLMTWEGKPINGLTLAITSSWPMPHSWQGSRMYAYRAMFNGRKYHGRGFDDGMLLRLRASRAKQCERTAVEHPEQ